MEELSIQCRNDMGTVVFTGGNVPGIGRSRTPKQSSNEQGDAGNEDQQYNAQNRITKTAVVVLELLLTDHRTCMDLCGKIDQIGFPIPCQSGSPVLRKTERSDLPVKYNRTVVLVLGRIQSCTYGHDDVGNTRNDHEKRYDQHNTRRHRGLESPRVHATELQTYASNNRKSLIKLKTFIKDKTGLVTTDGK